MSYNANNDNNQTTDRGLKEAFETVKNSFGNEGDYTGVKVLGGLAGVAAAGGLGYVGYNQWREHQGKPDTPETAEEFKQQAQPVKVDPQNQTATVVSHDEAQSLNSGYANQSSYNPAQYQQQQPPQYGQQGGYGQQQQQQQQQEDDHSSRFGTGLKVLGGLAGVAAVSGLGYVGYKEWLEHKQKDDSPQAAEEFKQNAQPVKVDPQTQTATVVGDESAPVSQQVQQQAQGVNVNGGSGSNRVNWQCQYGDKPYPNNAVPCGREPGGEPLFISRSKHRDGSLQVGKAGPSTGGGCLYPWGGKELYSSVYEVLVGDQNAVRWVQCRGRPDLQGATPVEAGKDTDGSPLYVAKVDCHGGCFPGKVGPNFNEAVYGYGGRQEKAQEYQVLVQN